MSPFYLLENTEPIFDELESHQVSLQAMQSSSAAGSFLDEVLKWQKRLQTIEAVVTAWLDVQEKWIELEEGYTKLDFAIKQWRIGICTLRWHEMEMFASSLFGYFSRVHNVVMVHLIKTILQNEQNSIQNDIQQLFIIY